MYMYLWIHDNNKYSFKRFLRQHISSTRLVFTAVSDNTRPAMSKTFQIGFWVFHLTDFSLQKRSSYQRNLARVSVEIKIAVFKLRPESIWQARIECHGKGWLMSQKNPNSSKFLTFQATCYQKRLYSTKILGQACCGSALTFINFIFHCFKPIIKQYHTQKQ